MPRDTITENMEVSTENATEIETTKVSMEQRKIVID